MSTRAEELLGSESKAQNGRLQALVAWAPLFLETGVMQALTDITAALGSALACLCHSWGTPGPQ